MKNAIAFFVFLFLFIGLSACGPAPTLSPTQTQQPEPTLTLTATVTATSTPVPPPTATATPVFHVHQSAVEVVTDQAVTGDGGNSWGGHQTRIVHTQDGIFTAYTVEQGGHFHREWRLAERQSNGTWLVLAKGDAGKDPVNLLAAPDGTLYVVGWPNARGTLWSGKPANGSLSMTSIAIPNGAYGNWPYASAGIDGKGDICILSSTGGETPGGVFNWSCYYPATGEWVMQTNQLDYRFCYTYLFPSPDGQLSIVSTRDVRWEALGYKQPKDTFDYVFNAYGYWHTANTQNNPLERLYTIEEKPTEQFPKVLLDAQQDAYLDTQGRLHVIYRVRGQSTQDAFIARHAILAKDGTLIADVPLPQEAGDFSRIFQDKKERFYLLGSAGLLYPMDKEGLQLGEPLQLDLGRYAVEYSGFGLSVPRTGTPLSDVMDVVFPSSNGSAWLYFQLDFSEAAARADAATQTVSDAPAPALSAAALQTMLEQAQVLFDENLVDPNLPGMDWWGDDPATLIRQNGTLTFKGNNGSGPQIHSQYGLKKNEACVASFRFTGRQGFQFKAMAGNWSDPDGASWGATDGVQSFYQIAQNDFVSQSLGFNLVEDRWYNAMLWVNGSATFTVRFWEKDNPEVYAERIFRMDNVAPWSERRWNCVLLVGDGSVEMSSYQELRFAPAP